MSLLPIVQGVPVAVPLALSHTRQQPLWNGASRRITPGALTLPLRALLFPVGGRT
jgi:hypothetical protein